MSDADALRDLLSRLIGTWEGTYKLWLEPGVLRSESAAHGVVRPVLDGRFVTHDYDWADRGTPQRGSMLLGCTDEGVLQASWIDTWHMGSGILFCNGGPTADVTGQYGPDDEPWHWRTEFVVPSAEELVITAWNITPAGEEAKATETTYRRVD